MRYQLSLDKCCGQCYDGASNMVGKSSGVAVRILSIQPRAHCTHCHAYSLSVKDFTKQTRILRDTMSHAGEIAILIKYSPKRETLLGNIKEQIEYEDENDFTGNGILKLSKQTLSSLCRLL